MKDSGERGASLVELLVAIAISVLVFSVLSTALVQFILTTRWGNHQLQVTNDIQVASLWLGRDAPEAASFTPGAGLIYGTLEWADSSHEYRYSYDSVNGALVREHFDGGVLQSTTTVARHIQNQGDVAFSIMGQLLSVSITSTSGGEVESADLDFALRTR
ncbi:MAG: type II secretion system protein J [Anaerolineales bacterium]